VSDQLPRKRIEPLAPPPGQFDRVMGEARYRRHRRVMAMLSVSFVFVAGLGGGLALGKDTPRDFYAALTQQDDGADGATPTTATSAEKSSSPKRKTTKKAREVVAPVATELTDPPRGDLAYRGQAVGPAGQPAAGLYVYVGVPGSDGFEPAGAAIGRTDSRGRFSLPCPHAPILLAPWPINAEAKSKARNVAWGATFVGGVTEPTLAEPPLCTDDREVDVTRVTRGSAVEGTVTMPEACEDSVLSMWVWLHNDRSVHVTVQDLTDGDTFRVSGLPPGQHTLGANHNTTKVSVGGGETVSKDVEFRCDGDASAPTVTPTTPTTTPTDTGSPLPTGLPTETETGTASADPTTSSTP
jgi:hypothetical protein